MYDRVQFRARRCVVAALVVAAGLAAAPFASRAASVTVLNVSSDPTRELYEDYNALFADHGTFDTIYGQ